MQSGQSGEGCRGSPMEKRYETRSGDLFVRSLARARLTVIVLIIIIAITITSTTTVVIIIAINIIAVAIIFTS